MKEFRILSTSGILGYGFPEASFYAGIEKKPDLIACDAGSTDPGPYYLGSGIPFTNPTAVKRDLRLIMKAAFELHIPMVIGSAGGSGADVHLERDLGLVREIAKEEGLSFRMAVISAEFEKDFLIGELEKGNIAKLGPAPEVTRDDIEKSTHIVAQMGVEPIINALNAGAQIVYCGRCYDPAAFAAEPIRLGYSRALSLHMGKILECAAISATPGSGSDCMMAYLHENDFEVEPLNPERKCTPLSVSAHTLYEKSNPYILPGPGGHLDLSACTFTAVTDRRVRVEGSQFFAEETPTVKLEGAKQAGFRTISIAGNRDPIFISQVDEILAGLKERTDTNLSADFDYRLDFIVYGKNGVMGPLEPLKETKTHEIGIVIDVVADSQEHANAVCAVARSTLLHYGYPGRIATAGNLAFPFSPSDIKVGPIYVFSIYALLKTKDPASLFRTRFETLGEVEK